MGHCKILYTRIAAFNYFINLCPPWFKGIL